MISHLKKVIPHFIQASYRVLQKKQMHSMVTLVNNTVWYTWIC